MNQPAFKINRQALLAPFTAKESGLCNADVYRSIWQDEPSLTEDAQGNVLGNDQRSALQIIGQKYILDYFGAQPLEITDIRAGACITTLQHLLKNAQQDININLIEAKNDRRVEYAAQVADRPHISIGKIHKGAVTDFTRPPPSLLSLLLRRPWFVKASTQDCVLMLHTIHSLKAADIVPAITYAYRLLKPGGVLVMAYARQDISAMGQVTQLYLERHKPETAQALQYLYDTKKRLLVDGDIQRQLNARFPAFKAELTTLTQETRTFRPTPEKLAQAMMMNDMLSADDTPFDPAMLEFAAQYLEDHPAETGLRQLPAEQSHRAGWYSALQPQQIAIISKKAV